ncbi:MAG: tetratricopeptide repeat protein [Terriglobia bacterium]
MKKTVAQGSGTPARGLLRWWQVFGIAAVAALIAYLPSIDGAFLFDDKHLPFSDPRAGSMPASFWVGGVRPVLMLSYWIDFLIAGNAPFFYHTTNILLHAAAATLVYFCAAALLDNRNQSLGVSSERTQPLAFFVAVLFLLHPLQTESVAYIAGRSEVLSGVFALGAFAVFLDQRRGSPGLRPTLAILLLLGAAILTKEHAVAVAGAIVLTDLYLNGGDPVKMLRRSAIFYTCLAILCALGAAMAFQVISGAATAGFSVPGVTPLHYFLTECRAIPGYLGLFIFPIRQNGDWNFAFSHSWLDHGAAIWGLALAGGVIAVVASRKLHPLAGYGLILFLGLLAPTSSFVPVIDAFAERRMYLPIFGLLLATAGILDHWKLAPARIWTVSIVLAVIAGGLTFHRSAVWSSDLAFWGDVVAKSPQNVRGHMGLGLALLERGRCSEAVHENDLVASLPQRPEADPMIKAEAMVNKASALECLGQADAAREALLAAVRLKPTSNIYNELGILAGRAGQVGEALTDFTEAIRLNPRDAQSYALRGVALKSTGDEAGAARDLNAALAIDPSNKIARENIAALTNENRN